MDQKPDELLELVLRLKFYQDNYPGLAADFFTTHKLSEHALLRMELDFWHSIYLTSIKPGNAKSHLKSAQKSKKSQSEIDPLDDDELSLVRSTIIFLETRLKEVLKTSGKRNIVPGKESENPSDGVVNETFEFPAGSKNNPLTFFEFLLENDGFSDFLLSMEMPYLEFAPSDQFDDFDDDIYDLYISFNLQVNKIIKSKIYAVKNLIEAKLSETTKDAEIAHFLKLMIVKLIHLDKILKSSDVFIKNGIEINTFSSLVDWLKSKYEIYFDPEIKKLVKSNAARLKITEIRVISANPVIFPEFHLRNYMNPDQYKAFMNILIKEKNACDSKGKTNKSKSTAWFCALISAYAFKSGYVNERIRPSLAKNILKVNFDVETTVNYISQQNKTKINDFKTYVKN
jgi:hypothetical protein